MNGRNVWGRGRKGAALFVLAGLLGSALLGGCLGDVHMLGYVDEDGQIIQPDPGLFHALILGPTQGMYVFGSIIFDPFISIPWPCEVDGETVACSDSLPNIPHCGPFHPYTFNSMTGSLQDGCFHGRLLFCLGGVPLLDLPMKSLSCE